MSASPPMAASRSLTLDATTVHRANTLLWPGVSLVSRTSPALLGRGLISYVLPATPPPGCAETAWFVYTRLEAACYPQKYNKT
jgi:hypothetical protein